MISENTLKTPTPWLLMGVINHSIALLVIAFGCVLSGFSCQGETMKQVLTTYTFTLKTPQVAIEVIILVALFMVINSLKVIQQNKGLVSAFLSTLAILFAYGYAG